MGIGGACLRVKSVHGVVPLPSHGHLAQKLWFWLRLWSWGVENPCFASKEWLLLHPDQVSVVYPQGVDTPLSISSFNVPSTCDVGGHCGLAAQTCLLQQSGESRPGGDSTGMSATRAYYGDSTAEAL